MLYTIVAGMIFSAQQNSNSNNTHTQGGNKMKFKNTVKVKDLNSDVPSDGEIFAEYLDFGSCLKIMPPWALDRSNAIRNWRNEFAIFLRDRRIKLVKAAYRRFE